jgi:hypothetical protein
MMISMMASNQGFRIMYADVSRAYFYAKAVRPVYVKLPDEDREEGDEARCGKLLMSMYGTRDAALNWSQEYTRTLVESGFVQGSSNPCLFQHPITKVAVMVHGDDFVAVAREEDLKDTIKFLEDKYKLKVQNLGEGKDFVDEVRILNKILRCTESGVELEADPRHAELVITELGLENAKASRVPGNKVTDENLEAQDRDSWWQPKESETDTEAETLDAESARRYRAVAARLTHLAVDRPDIQYAVKEAARAMSSPCSHHWQQLSKTGKYLLVTPRLIFKFPCQDESKMVITYTNSD